MAPSDSPSSSPSPSPSQSPAQSQSHSQSQPYAPVASSSSTSTTPSSKSLFARLRLPFASRNRTLSDYFVSLEDPYRHYSPGDLVKGAVVLTVAKPIRLTHLVVCLHGFVQVFKGAGAGSKQARRPVCSAGAAVPGDERDGEGFLSMCQDHVVLCGEGRLEAGAYEFKFELEVPGKQLPSSIDFERGTISYNIISTLTRPTRVSPTTSCDRKLQLVETIDVGPIDAPKPHMVSMTPTARRSKSKAVLKREAASIESVDEASTNAPNPADVPPSPLLESSTSEPGAARPVPLPHRPPPSELSTESSMSESAGSLRSGAQDPSSTSQQSTRRTALKAALADKPVRATIELSKGGCLPGDVLSVRVMVDHIRPVRSMQGLIVTFYRQSRIDSNAAVSGEFSGGSDKNADDKADGYFPRPKASLGGLSFSSSNPVRKYRMDLSQALVPLIIDRWTLQTTVRASIKVPDDVFPTISSVPGDMISFRYYIEVMLHLKGKLSGQDSILSQLGVRSSASDYTALGAQSTEIPGRRGDPPSTWLGSIIDTELLRREKSVVVRTFEVTVGTRDSRRGANRGRPQARSDERLPIGSTSIVDDSAPDYAEHALVEEPRPVLEEYHALPEHGTAITTGGRPSVIDIPPPQMDESGDEKTRLRQAEERLLPSRPPGEDDDGGSPPSATHPSGPSAPIVHGASEADGAGWGAGRYWDQEPSAPRLEDLSSPAIASSGSAYLHQNPLDAAAGPSEAPPFEDKQELERQRLQAEASAPDDRAVEDDEDDDNDYDYEGRITANPSAAAAAAAAATAPVLPSAPVLTEDDLDGHVRDAYYLDDARHQHHHGHDRGDVDDRTPYLPRYER